MPSHDTRTAISRRLFAGDLIEGVLSYYPPGMQMASHCHDHDQVSVLLGGALHERSGAAECSIDTEAIGIKPAGVRHANRYGKHGTLILAVIVKSRSDFRAAVGSSQPWTWRTGDHDGCMAFAKRWLGRQIAHGNTDPEGDLTDFLALVGQAGHPAHRHRHPPAWTRRVREQLIESDSASLATIAAEHGLHPAYLSRAFTRFVGCPPSRFRARARFGRALSPLIAGQPIAEAALQAGYADQSHLTRSTRQACGLTPRQIRRVLTRAQPGQVRSIIAPPDRGNCRPTV